MFVDFGIKNTNREHADVNGSRDSGGRSSRVSPAPPDSNPASSTAAWEKAETGLGSEGPEVLDVSPQKSPASTIGELAHCLKDIYNSKVEIKNIGIRHAEKMHETLLSKEEFMGAEDLGEYYRVAADNRDLNYDKYYSKGSTKVELKEYNSFNTHRLSEIELKELLAQIDIK